MGSHNTGFATKREVVAPVRSPAMEALAIEALLKLESERGAPTPGHVEGSAAAAAAEGAEALRAWFAGFLRAREIAEIDAAIRDGGDLPIPEQAYGKRRLGPLQVGFCLMLQRMHSISFNTGKGK